MADFETNNRIELMNARLQELESELESIKVEMDQSESLAQLGQDDPVRYVEIGSGLSGHKDGEFLELSVADKVFPFKLNGGGGGVTVMRDGSWTRNGTKVSLSGASHTGTPFKGLGFTDISGLLTAGSTNYVYVQLDDDVTPTTLTIGAATTEPSETLPENIYKLIGVVITDGSNNATDVRQKWWGGDIDDTTAGLEPDNFRWQVIPYTSSSIRVTAGNLNYYGILSTHAQGDSNYSTDALGDFIAATTTSLSIPSAGYVYIELNKGNNDLDAGTQVQWRIKFSATYPQDRADDANTWCNTDRVKVLCYINPSSPIIQSDITQYEFSDFDHNIFEPDTNQYTLNSAAPDDIKQQRSLEILPDSPESGVLGHTGQIYGFHDPASFEFVPSAEPDGSIERGYLLTHNNNYSTDKTTRDQPAAVGYAPMDSFWLQIIEDIGDGHLTLYPHTDLSFSFTGGLGVGKSGGNTDQDDVYWRAYDDGSGLTNHDTFIDSKDFWTSGEMWAQQVGILDNADAQTTNVWNETDLTVDVTDVEVDATTSIDLTTAGNSGTDDLLLKTTGAISQMKLQAAAQMNLSSDGSIQAVAGLNSVGALLLQTTGASSSLDVTAANDYNESVGGDLTVDGNTAVDDTASGVGRGRIIDLNDFNTSESAEDAWFEFELMYG